ncbi:MAG: histidinol-phosphatase [Planctomycetes bacterium]|nr:histidinol-phosphatase [Planctomycetota bacterium]
MKNKITITVFSLLTCSLLSGCSHWYKGNTHTHTYWSDGNAAPEHVVDWYVNHNYNFLVLSDHNILSHGEKWYPIGRDDWRPLLDEHIEDLEKRFGPVWVVKRDIDGTREMLLKTLPQLRDKFEINGKFIMIQGEEITDSFERAAVHINAVNINELIPPQHGDSVLDTIQRNFDAVIEQSKRFNQPMFAHINHPNMGHAINAQTIARIKGERFFEVYNGHRGVLTNGDENTPSADKMWDIALTLRLTDLDLGLLYGLATDDTHNHHGKGKTSQPGRGWVWVKSNKLTADSIVKAMRNGEFYASTGVKLKKIKSSSRSISLSIVPEDGVTYRTDFLGSRLVDGEVIEVGEVLACTNDLKPKYKMKGDELYVRARITSSRKHPNPFAEGDMEMAWVQPVLGPAAKHN